MQSYKTDAQYLC